MNFIVSKKILKVNMQSVMRVESFKINVVPNLKFIIE